jgi:phosphoribosyl-ATP pyrophosphohydrolase
VAETSDLLYHLLVLLAERNVPFSDVEEELHRRSLKIGNLKQMKTTDRNT